MAGLKDYFPSREAELVNWSNNFSTKISATPTAFGLSALQASSFATVNTAWVNAYNAANDDSTNSRAARITKDDAKRVMIANARALVKIVQAFPGITDTQRADLGITVPKPGPTPSPVATEAPELTIASVNGHMIKVRLRELGSEKRGKPKFTFGALLMSYAGETPPPTAEGWRLEGTVTRSIFEVLVPGTVAAGTKVWFSACW